MKIKRTVWTVAICDYNTDDDNRLYLNSDVYLNESNAKERYRGAKQYLKDLATNPAREYGGFTGRRFETKTSEERDDSGTRVSFKIERVTDVPQERYRGELQLTREEVEIDVPLDAQITSSGLVKINVK